MKTHYLLLAACLMAVGCNEPGPISGVQVLSPGRAMHLAYRCEISENGRSGEWPDAKLSLRIASLPCMDNLRVNMMLERFVVDNMQGMGEKGDTRVFERGSSTAPVPPQEDEFEPFRDANYIAVVDRNGRVVSADAKGKYWRAHKKELAEVRKQGASRGYVDQVISWVAPGIFPALADAMAYLPPQGVEPGQSWQVLRERVLPYHAYGFYMFTNGCGYSREESTCTLKTVRTGSQGKIAVIAILGKRVPQFPEPSRSERVKFLRLTGKLEVNLTTGAVEKLRLESIPTWVSAEDEQWNLKFVHVVSLKPA